MNKKLFEYCQKHLRDLPFGQLKSTPSLKKLADDYNVGYIDNGRFYFTAKDKQHLIEMVALEHNGIHLFRDHYPQAQSRIVAATWQRNEKQHALNVTEAFVLVNSLNSLRINNQEIALNSLTTLGQYVCADEIKTIQHPQIILVENLIVMANLSRLAIPDCLKNALWLYRGDIKAQQQTSRAYQFFKAFKETHQLICFSDLDPSGLQIAMTSGASQFLSIGDECELKVSLQGEEQQWFKQQNAISYLNNNLLMSPPLNRLFDAMKQSQKTLKQEHMVAHYLKLKIYPLFA
ncbi:hypothetical protein CW745_02885 [Psychromonas sp. psych-6C06]|uniref:DUF7281 domain-containing protein n=1 Tax=Psychromonas sp. psych-6C06 TaxID=2058089 RepID=UPI000C32F972|nr:hypothetical protein [Psychromonas sp. psych-6C06]PKF63800.1 hypothetical protein CW745_02885 [Psychromonas sp. psych-6C06]